MSRSFASSQELFDAVTNLMTRLEASGHSGALAGFARRHRPSGAERLALGRSARKCIDRSSTR